jgi:hypothetical protein
MFLFIDVPPVGTGVLDYIGAAAGYLQDFMDRMPLLFNLFD